MVAAGAVSVQFGGAIAVTLFGAVGAGGAVALRLVIAAVILVVGTLLGQVVGARRGAGRASRHHQPSDWLAAGAFGLALAAMNLSFYEAIARIPLGPAVSVELLGPLSLAAMASRRWVDAAWVALALAGVSALGLGEDRRAPMTMTGVAFALLAGACWAGYIMLSAQAGRRFDRTDGLTLAMLLAAVVVLPIGLFSAGSALLRPDVLWRGVTIAVLSSALPYTLELLALRRIRPSTFGVLMSLEPAIASVAGLLVIDQVLGAWQWAGLVAVVVACAGVTVFAPARVTAAATAQAP